MSGKEINQNISFDYANKTLNFELGKKVKDYKFKQLESLFKAIVERDDDGDGKISKKERKVSEKDFSDLKTLKEVFKIHKEQDVANKWADADKKGVKIEDFLADLIKDDGKNGETRSNQGATTTVPATVTTSTPAVTTEVDSSVPVATTSVSTAQTQGQNKASSKALNSFNNIMQEKAAVIDKTNLKFDKEYPIKSGDTLWAIAAADLGGKPTGAQIQQRIAEIVAMNPSIKNVNSIAVGTKIKLATLGEKIEEAPKPGEEVVVEDGDDDGIKKDVGTKGTETDTVSVELQESRIKVTNDKAMEGEWSAPVELTGEEYKAFDYEPQEGFPVTKKTQGEGENQKVIYSVDSKEFTSMDQLKSFERSVGALKQDGVRGETKAEKEARFEANKALLDAILTTGERDAIEWVIINGADYISPDQMKEIRLDVVRTQDKGLIDVMLGQKAENFGAIMKDAPDLQQEVADLYKGLLEIKEDKRSDSQKELINCLKECVGKNGANVPAQEDKDGNELVGERNMFINSNGDTYWESYGNVAYNGEKLDKFGKAWNAAKKLDKAEDKNKALVKAITDSISDDSLLNKTITKNFLPKIDKILATVTDDKQKGDLVKSIMDKYIPEVVANLDKDSYNALNLFVQKYGTEEQKAKFLKDHPLKKDLDNRKEDKPITLTDLKTAVAQGLAKEEEVGGYSFFEYNEKEYYFSTEDKVVARPIGYKYGLDILNKTKTDSGVSEDQFDEWFGTKESPRITKDNILAVIKGFSENAGGKKGLIQTLDDDWNGPTKAQMDKIVNLVFEAAKTAGLEEDEAYTALSNALANATEGIGGDYSSGKAKALDDAINTLITKMDEKAENDAKAAKNKASADAKNAEAQKVLKDAAGYENTKVYKDLQNAIAGNKDASKNTEIDKLVANLKKVVEADKAEGAEAYKITGDVPQELAQVMARVNEELALLKESTTELTEPDAEWFINLSDKGRVLLEIKNWEVVGISVQYDKTNEENFYMTAEELRYDSDKKDASFDGVVKNDQYNWTAWKERLEKLFGIKEPVVVNVPDDTENKDAVQAKFNEVTAFLQTFEPNCAKDVEAQKHALGGWTKTYTLSDGKSVAAWYDEQGEIKQLHINTDGEAKFKSEDGSMKDKVEVSIANDLAGVRLDSSHADYDSRISSGFDFEQVKRVVEALFGKFEPPAAEE